MTQAKWSPDAPLTEPDEQKLQYVPARADSVRLERFVSECFRRVGVPAADADLVGRILVDADLRGSETHGVALLYTHYIQAITDGDINAQPVVQVQQGSPTTVSVDGDRGLGMLVSHHAMTECLRMATEYGSGWATVFNSTHSAAGAYYVRMAAELDMVGFHWSTGGTTIAAPGGGERLIGNNPFSFAAPGGQAGAFVLDMAPSTTIRPKIRMRGWEGSDLPVDWVVDHDGSPITDPSTYFEREGAILPLGSSALNGAYKGFGLLLMSDVLTGALSGDGGSLLRRKGEHTHAFGALRIDAFPTGGDFAETMDAMAAKLHSATTLPGQPPVRFPGERANREYAARRENGIPLRQFVVDELREMADELGVSLDGVWRS